MNTQEMYDKTFKTLPIGKKIAAFDSAVKTLAYHSKLFNRLSLDNVKVKHLSSTLNEVLIQVTEALTEYCHWKSNAAALLKETNEAISVHDTVIQVAVDAASQFDNDCKCDSPYKLIDIELLQGRIRDNLLSLMYTFNVLQHDPMIDMLESVMNCAVDGVFLTMFKAMKVFGVHVNEEFITEAGFLTSKVGKEPEYPEIVLNDEVVYFSDEEKARIREQEQREAEELARAKEMADKIEATKEDGKLIVECYNKQLHSGGLTYLRINDSDLARMLNPTSDEDCELIESMHRMLMSMSNAVRYMPGEEGSSFDRIMGSFMELDKDVCSYKARFLMYLGEYGLTHNDVVKVLDIIRCVDGDSSFKLSAQYVDTKKFIDTPISSNASKSASIHIFLQR